MEKTKYYFERSYPYLLAAAVVGLTIKMKINFIESEQLNNALDACNTVVALIIGFLGAILPVILGMKNESKLVKYVFENDKNKLFLKYIKATIFIGLIALFVTIIMYFSGDFPNAQVAYYLFYIWELVTVCFLCLTYRSLKNMLNIIFLSDKDMKDTLYNKITEKRIEEKIQEEFAE